MTACSVARLATGETKVKLNRRDTLILAGAASAASLAGLGAANAKEGDMFDVAKLMAPDGLADKVLGSPMAKVTLIEYASPTCPHCAFFATQVLPDFRKQYVDTGKVKFIMRPFVRNVLDAVVFLLAEAAAGTTEPTDAAAATPPASGATEVPPANSMMAAPQAPAAAASADNGQAAVEAYHNVVATFFKTQDQWMTAEKPRDAILAIAKQLGFTEESFDAALTNQDLFKGMETLRDQAINDFKLEGTPTFYVNGKQLTGEKTLEQLAAEIDPLLT
jgi:protein-disulfide isomerase